MDWIVSVIAASLAVAAPLLYGALGEIFTQRSGIMNLGLEGVMLVALEMSDELYRGRQFTELVCGFGDLYFGWLGAGLPLCIVNGHPSGKPDGLRPGNGDFWPGPIRHNWQSICRHCNARLLCQDGNPRLEKYPRSGRDSL